MDPSVWKYGENRWFPFTMPNSFPFFALLCCCNEMEKMWIVRIVMRFHTINDCVCVCVCKRQWPQFLFLHISADNIATCPFNEPQYPIQIDDADILFLWKVHIIIIIIIIHRERKRGREPECESWGEKEVEMWRGKTFHYYCQVQLVHYTHANHPFRPSLSPHSK